jgi:hypothetical protein
MVHVSVLLTRSAAHLVWDQGKNAVVGKSLRRVNAAMSKSVVLTGEWSAAEGNAFRRINAAMGNTSVLLARDWSVAEGNIAFRRVNAVAVGKHVLLTRDWSAAVRGAFRRIIAAMGKSVLLEMPVNNLDPEFNFFWQ